MDSWIPNFFGEYKIDTDGNVYSYKKWHPDGRIKLTPKLNKKYSSVVLNKQTFRLDKLVYDTFYKTNINLKKRKLIHIDGNIHNNKLSNLRTEKIKKKKIGRPKKEKKIIIKKPKYKYTLHNETDNIHIHFKSKADIAQYLNIPLAKVTEYLSTKEYIYLILSKKDIT